MMNYIKKLFSVVFVVLVVAMFSGCASTLSPSASDYQSYDRYQDPARGS